MVASDLPCLIKKSVLLAQTKQLLTIVNCLVLSMAGTIMSPWLGSQGHFKVPGTSALSGYTVELTVQREHPDLSLHMPGLLSYFSWGHLLSLLGAFEDTAFFKKIISACLVIKTKCSGLGNSSVCKVLATLA